MDQPVVMLERLPESVIQKFLNREMKVFEYNRGYKVFQDERFPNKKYFHKKPHWLKKSLVKTGFYNKTAFHKQTNYKIMANGSYNNFHKQRNNELYNKTNKFHPGESNLVVEPHQLHNSVHQTANSQVSSELGNARHFSNNQDRTKNNKVSSEQLLKQGKKRSRSGERISRKESTSANEENCEDVNESLIQDEEFDSHDWQIVSEASCSDVSRDSSPSRENLLDAEYSVHTELEDNEALSKQKTKLTDTYDDSTPIKCIKWQDILHTQNEKLNQTCASDEDDRLTEPYRSECEEESDNKEQNNKSTKSCKPYIRIKLAGSHKNGFTNITDESDKEKLTRNELKVIAATEPYIKGENNHTKISVNHSTCPTSAAVINNLPNEKGANNKDLTSSIHCIPNKHIEKGQSNAPDDSHSNRLENTYKGEATNNFNGEFQKNKSKQNVLSFAASNTRNDSEVKTSKSNSLQLDNHAKREHPGNKQIGQTAPNSQKSESVNARHLNKCPSNTENRTESAQNGQNIANKESKFNRYDYVGLIMQTMDKSAPYSVTAKSDDNDQKANANDESQNLSFKSNGINKVHNHKETVILPGRKELPVIPCFKQKKARMSRVTSLSKSFLCKDLKGTVINKTECVNYASRLIDMSESKSGSVLNDHVKISGDNEKPYRKADVVSNINSDNKKLNTQILTDKQGVKALAMKTPRRCWRCGKQFGNNSNVTDRLCKQCNSIDYTAVTQKLSNIHSTCKSKDNDCNKSLQTSYNHWKNKTNLSEKPNINNLERRKSIENADSFHNKSISLVHQKNEENQVTNNQNENLSPLKLIFSLGSNKLVEKIARDKDMVAVGDAQSKKLKKKRMRSASDTVEGVYEANKCVSNLVRQTTGGNLICKISKKKRKHKDLPKRKKKPKLEDGDSDISDGRNQSSDDADQHMSGYYSEDNITSKCKSKDNSNGHNELSLNQLATNQLENTIDDNSSRHNKSSLNKKGNCEVRNVNKGLFLLSFSETDEELYQLSSNLSERSKRESNEIVTEQIKSKEDSCVHLQSPEQVGNTNNLTQKVGSSRQQVDVNFQKLPLSDTVTSDSLSQKQSSPIKHCPTLLELQELVPISQPAVTSSQEMPVFQNLSSIETKTESNKLTSSESENHICEDDDSENKLSMPRIESVYSLKDVEAEDRSDDKRTTEVKMPFLFNHNTYNELDAYTTASILDMDGTKERSLTVLMSLLSREYKELQYVHQASKKSEVVTVELQNEKLRHIDNIRTLQLACALFKQCQKCNKELSPEMLNLRPEEISQLLAECGNGISTEPTVSEKNNIDKDAFASLKLGTNDKQKEESKKLADDDNRVTSGISGETKMSGNKPVMHTTNTRKTVKFLLNAQQAQQNQLECTTNTSTTAIVNGAPAIKRKSDDDVICLGISQLPRSSVQVVHPLDHRNVSQNDLSNNMKSPEVINNKNNDSQSATVISPNLAPPNVSVIKSHGLASPPAIPNFIASSTSTNSIPLQVIPGLAVTHPLQVAVNVVTSAAAYQRTAVGYVKHQNYPLPTNSLSIQKDSNNSKQPYIVSQLSKLPNGTSWIQSGIQNQWSTSTATNEVLTNMRNQAWRNNPGQSNTPTSVPNQKSVQQMPVASNPMLPLINQYGAAVTGQHVIHGGLSVQAARNLPPVPPMYNHSTARTWHQPPKPLNAALRPTQQTPVVCIACRNPIGMTCPTGMFCSDVCKKTYCAHFPNYR